MSVTPALLKKLLALAEDTSTTASERKVAQQKFDQLLQSSGLSLAEIMTEEESIHIMPRGFKVNKLERMLAAQILGMIQHRNTVRCHWVYPKKQRGFYIWATELQSLEFQMLMPYYLKAFRQSLPDYVAAFIHANNLTSEVPAPDSALSKEDLERMQRISNLIRGIKPVPTPHKQLKA